MIQPVQALRVIDIGEAMLTITEVQEKLFLKQAAKQEILLSTHLLSLVAFI